MRRWGDIVVRTGKQVKGDNVPLLSAGVAFYAMLALFPALIALVSIYGLVAGPDEVAVQFHSFTRAMPAEAAQLITNQIADLTTKSSGGLSTAAIIGVLGALWAASSGMRWLLSALTLAYEGKETRKFIKLRGLALVFTLGAILASAVSVGVLVATPSLFRALGLGPVGKTVINVARWPFLASLLVFGLSVLYRFGPNRVEPSVRKRQWFTWGSAVAAAVWLAGSVGFSIYAAMAGKFNETYGALGGVIVLLLWLYLSAFAILLGAELNCELEKLARTALEAVHEEVAPPADVAADSLGGLAPIR